MRFRFGDCVFDSQRRELTRAGAAMHAGPKVLKLLELLLDTRPRALTKDEIHKSLWADTFVSDATLTSLVAELRSAIGDDARNSVFVRTIHGYGYSFRGDVWSDRSSATEPLAGDRDPQRRFLIAIGEREIALSRGDHVLGRSTDAAVYVDAVGVSRQHARITIRENGAVLEDLGSKNGTTLNGHALNAPAPLADGAVIVLGTTVLKFRVIEAAGSTETLQRPL
jgi:DNA-binding winged helix-turn-helix (wHTH) protein